MARLLQAASDEFGEQGFASATTASIARRAEVTEAQLFRYFRSKAELFREAVFKPLDQRLAAFNEQHLVVVDADKPEDFKKQSRQYITSLQQFIRDNWKTLMSLVVAQAYAPETVRGMSDVDSLHTYFERNTALMAERVGDNPRVAPELMVRVSFAAVLANVMFEDWIFPQGKTDREEISDAIIEFVLNGLNANYRELPD